MSLFIYAELRKGQEEEWEDSIQVSKQANRLVLHYITCVSYRTYALLSNPRRATDIASGLICVLAHRRCTARVVSYHWSSVLRLRR